MSSSPPSTAAAAAAAAAATTTADIVSRPTGSNLDIVTKSDGTRQGVCNIISLVPLSYNEGEKGTDMFTAWEWYYPYVITQYLAVKHLNEGNGSIINEITGLNKTCNIKFELEVIDTEYNVEIAGNRVLERLGFSGKNNETCSKLRKREETYKYGACTFLESAVGSAVADATSYLTGAAIPEQSYTEVSGSSIQPSLDDRETNLGFARTIPALTGGAEPLVEFMIQKLNTQYFAVLSIGGRSEHYVNHIQDVVNNMNKNEIQMKSITINESYYENGTAYWDNIPTVVSQLKQLKFNAIYAYLPEMSGGILLTDNLMELAYNQLVFEGIGGETIRPTWIFAGDGTSIHNVYLRTYTPDSTLYKAYRGSGTLFAGNVNGQKNDVFERELLQLRNSPDDIEQLLSIFPTTSAMNDTATSYLLNGKWDTDSFYFDPRLNPFQYEATILSGLAACNAVDDELYLSRDSFYKQILDTEFVGITGNITLDSTTGSREPSSIEYIMLNLPGLNYSNESATEFPFQVNIADTFDNNIWDQADAMFVFNDGTTQPPPEIQPWDLQTSPNLTLGKGVKAVGSILTIIPSFLALACALWTYRNRKNRIVCASQPFFLYLICGGTIILASSIIPYLFDLNGSTMLGMKVACNATLWLIILGGSIVISSFFSKTHRINKIVRSSKLCKRVKVSERDVMVPIIVLIALNILLLILMSIFHPVVYTTYEYGPTDNFDRSTQVYGRCDFQSTKLFLSLLAVVNGCMLIATAYEGYQARTLATEFQETEQILKAVLTMIIVLLVGLPVYAMNEVDPKNRVFIYSVMVFALCIAILFAMFLPKIRYKEKMKRKENNIIVYGVGGLQHATTSGADGSFSQGEKILTGKSRKELLAEIATLRRQLERYELLDVEDGGNETAMAHEQHSNSRTDNSESSKLQTLVQQEAEAKENSE